MLLRSVRLSTTILLCHGVVAFILTLWEFIIDSRLYVDNLWVKFWFVTKCYAGTWYTNYDVIYMHRAFILTFLTFWLLQSLHDNAFLNPFSADVANKRHLGSAPKSHLCDDRENWSAWLVWSNDSFHWPEVFILQRDARSIQFWKNTLNWLKIDSVDQKFVKILLKRVWELLTRRWNARHWEKHYVFTAGGERNAWHWERHYVFRAGTWKG
jgi:hypothetical protein